jgi:excisionase family DNA binding protein
MVSVAKSLDIRLGAKPPLKSGSVIERFRHFEPLTSGDTTAAAVLVLAEAIRSPEESTQTNRLLSVAEVANHLHVSTGTVYNLINSGQLAAQRIGTGHGRQQIDPADLARYQLEAKREACKAPPGQATLSELRELAKRPAVRPRQRAA